jgi:DNA-binding PadR family transcriptional regulator
MSKGELTETSYLVLGLVARLGTATPYEMKGAVADSVGYFWSFPHSQLYAEPVRLAERGLLTEDREESGRRRRRYSITAAGREALTAWLDTPTEEAVELRDPGLLRLFFAELATREQLQALAATRATVHRRQLAAYEAIRDQLGGLVESDLSVRTLRRGIYAEQSAVRFWDEVAAELSGGG